MYCVNCGAKNSSEVTFCQKCGKQLYTTDQDEPTVSTNPPALLSPYGDTPYATTPSTSSDTVFAPPPPPGIAETASSSELPHAPPTQRLRDVEGTSSPWL